MPDGVIKLYEYFNVRGEVSTLLSNEGLVIEQFMPMGEDLESYFMNRIGGVHLG
jgi:ABC-2 type transport system ATP-binding protein